jgi:hypothetical protein
MTAQNRVIWVAETFPVEDIHWNSVVSNELPRLYNYFRYRLGDEPLAEDLTSAVLEKAWLKRPNMLSSIHRIFKPCHVFLPVYRNVSMDASP